MSLELTDNAIAASEKTGIRPNLILEIDGVSTLYGAVNIQKYIRIGDPGLLIDGSWTIGGLNDAEDQSDVISFEGTGTKINQQLLPDKGSVSSASSISVQLIDFNQEITQLVSPGVIVDDILGRSARLYLGFKDTAWPEDYVEIFRGFVDDIVNGPGFVRLNLVHPEKKKFQQIFVRTDSKLTAPASAVDTTLSVENASTFFRAPYVGPDATVDPALTLCARIDDEVVRYTGVTGTTLTGVTRGYLGTAAVPHLINAKVQSYYVLEDDTMNVALKVMLSGKNGPWRTGLACKSFNQITPTLNIPNAIGFDEIDITAKYGLSTGDYITTTGASNGANNVALMTVASIVVIEGGSYITVNGVSFVDEPATAATIDLRSQYDTLGQGLGMSPEEVDVPEHQRWRQIQLGSFEYRFYLQDTVDGKKFLDEQVYAPYGSYSIPRKGRASVGYHIGPIPTADITTLSRTNIKSPSKIQIRRTTTRHFMNAVAYKFDESPIEEDKFFSGTITIDVDSQSRIPIGNSVFTIESKGIRSDLLGVSKTALAAARRLGRYKFAAEHFESVEVMFGDGFNLEPGDILIMDFDGLFVANTSDGTRSKPAKFFEVINRSLDIKTGAVQLNLVDTNFDATERYGLISPSSTVATAGTTTHVIIQDSYGALYPGNEKKKWEDYVGLPVLVHSPDFSFSEEVTFTGFDPGNPYKMNFHVTTPLSSPSVVGWIVDIPPYSSSTSKSVNTTYKLIHAHQSPIVPVVSGASPTVFDVGVADASKFFIGSIVRVHTEDFTDYSPELKVTDVSGVTITIASSLGFTPGATHFVSFIGFPDGDQAYRLI